MTSQNFASKCLSLDNLKVRDRCGLMSLAAHRRCTVAFETPAIRAMLRQLHRPCVAGGVTALSSTMRTASGGREGLRPRPAASSNPATRTARKRLDQWLTVTRDTPTRAAIRSCAIPAALKHDDLGSLSVAHGHRRRVDPPLQLAALLGIQYDLAARHRFPQHGIAAASAKSLILSSYFRDTTLDS